MGRVAFVVAIVLLGASSAFADRLFAVERGVAVSPVDGAQSYEWQASNDGAPWVTIGSTTSPSRRVQAVWGLRVVYRVRATAGSVVGEWSDPSEPALWIQNGVADGQRVSGGVVVQLASLAGRYLCGGEWKAACP